VTRLVHQEITVELGPDGAPARISSPPLPGRLEPVARWLVEQDWWDRPVAREYWKAIFKDSLLCELYHDLERDTWVLERVYD